MINELNVIENFDVLYNKTVVLYGAGKQGERMAAELPDRKIAVRFICDSDVKKWGQTICGIKVISPAQLKQLDSEQELVIIISAGYAATVERITEMLQSLMLRTKWVVTLFGLKQALKHHQPHRDEELPERWQRIEATYNIRQQWRLDHLNNLMSAGNILVYQPGKVGSQTIMNSMLRAGLIEHFYSGHLHTLNYPEMEAAVREAIELKIASLRRRGPIKIITLVREPLSRDLAFLFEVMVGLEEKLPTLTGTFIEVCSKRMEKIALAGDFLFGRPSGQYGFQFEWFDYELKRVFGVDVFAHPFDQEKGYTVIRQGDIEVLVIKLEKLASLEAVVGNFTKSSGLRLVNYNEGADKPYKYLYKDVKKAIKLSPEIVSLYYRNNPRMDHFYSEAEKATFLENWRNNIC